MIPLPITVLPLLLPFDTPIPTDYGLEVFLNMSHIRE